MTKDLQSAPAALPCLSVKDNAVQLEVVLAPRASCNAIVGLHNGRLKIAVTAPPVEGAANENLIELLAKSFKLPKRAVLITRGEHSKQKTIVLGGANLNSAAATLSALLARGK